MRQKIIIIGIALALCATSPAAATPTSDSGAGIVAVVGGDAITAYDVDNRIKFIIVTAKLSNTPDVIEHIHPQVIRSLIDEKLELQEATKNDIKITDDDIKKAIADIETQRGMPPGTIDNILKENGIPKTAFTQQIHAQLAWNRLLITKIKPKIRITEEEIALTGKRIALLPPPKPKTGGPQELKISVITLPVDKPAREAEMKKLSEKLVKEARGGANFEEISRQFSSGAADAGGKVEAFWINPQQLDPHVAQALYSVAPGAITDPVRTNEGYVIIKVYDAKSLGGAAAKAAAAPPAQATDTQVNYKEILLRLKLKPETADKDADLLLQIAEDVAKHPGTCKEKDIAGISNADDLNIETNMRTAFLSDLPPAIHTIIDGLKVGGISTPFASSEGIRLFMLCDKKENITKTPDHEQVFRMLMQQRMELEARECLRNLHREAFIEVR